MLLHLELNRLCAKCRHPRWCHNDPPDVETGDFVCDYNEGACEGCFSFEEGLDEFVCDWTDEEEEIACGRSATLGGFCHEHGLH